MVKKCVICGKEFETEKEDKEWCSKKCYQERYRKLHSVKRIKERKTGVCIICGKKFEMKKKTQICCSEECGKIRNNEICKQKGGYYRELAKQRKAAEKKKKPKALWEIEAEAREHGMSYCKYVALKGL